MYLKNQSENGEQKYNYFQRIKRRWKLSLVSKLLHVFTQSWKPPELDGSFFPVRICRIVVLDALQEILNSALFNHHIGKLM